MIDLEDGIIELDSERGNHFGFSSERYQGYLWKQDDAIIVSFIISRKRGNFRELVAHIHAHGFTVKIPTPLGRMQEIVIKEGYAHSQVPFSDEDPSPVDMYSLAPKT